MSANQAPGAPLTATAMSGRESDTVNIASHLPRMAALHPDTPAIVCALRGRGDMSRGRFANWIARATGWPTGWSASASCAARERF
jgi:hypothetical protein